MMKRKLTMEHAFLLSLEKRSRLTTDQEWQLNRCESGHGGESELDQIVEEHGNSTWFHFKNIWIDYLGCTQIDSLIITENGIHLIDTKNYTNHYTYQNHTWFHRDKALSKNINQQLLDNLTKCQSLSKKIPEMKNIQGTIVFINERAIPSILDPMPVNYLFRYQLFDWIDSLRQPKSNVKMNIQKTAEAIKQYIVPNPYDYKSVCSIEEFAALKKGIYCKQCSSFKVDIGKYNVNCSCGIAKIKNKQFYGLCVNMGC